MLSGALVALAVTGGFLVAPAPAAAADAPSSVVEDYAYLGAEQILAEHGVRLLKGDGGIRYVADCGSAPDLFQVESLVGSAGQTYCFEVLGPRGFVTMDVPNVYLVRGAGRAVVAKATHEGETETVTVPPGSYEPIGGGNATHTLVELRVAGTPATQPGPASPYPFVAKVDTAERGCGGVLVSPLWLVTAATCFAADGNVAAGPPPNPTTAVLGRADLGLAGGVERTVVELVPRTDRDLTLAKLNRAVSTIAPVALGRAAPAAGAEVRAVGYGRTATEWVGTKLRDGAYLAGATTATTIGLTRASGTAAGTCKGDAGGPALLTQDGRPHLVGVHSASWQAGCVGVTETRDAAVEARTDDLADWIADRTRATSGPAETWTANAYYGSRGTFFADVDGDNRADAIVVNDNAVYVRRSTGTAFGTTYEPWTTNPYYGSRGTYFADVDGDNRADAIVVNDGGVHVRRSTGSAFGAYEPWTANPYYGSRGTFFADVDGDNRADAIVVNDNAVYVRRSTGTAFGTTYEPWTTNPYYGSRGTYFADIDGDGRADALVVNDSGVYVRRSTGSGFAAFEAWIANPYYGSRGTFFADIDGDGRADALVVNDGGVTARRVI